MRKCEYILFEKTFAKNFNEAYPIGNGKLGGMVYGEPRRMRLGLNHDELWAGFHSERMTEAYDTDDFLRVKSLVKEGKYREAQDLYERSYAIYDGGAYLTLGDLFLEFPEGEITDYKRALDIKDSVASVEFKLDGGAVLVEYIASYPKNALFINVKCERNITFSASPELEMISSYEKSGSRITAIGQCPKLCERQKTRSHGFPDADAAGGVRFAAALDVTTVGDVHTENRKITVSAKEATFVFSCETSYKDGFEYGKENYKELLTGYIDSAIGEPYSELKKEHTEDVRQLFDRVRFTLDSPDTSDIPTGERIKRYAENGEDNALAVLEFNMGRYFLIAASRPGSRATNLQGIWNDSPNAPWCSNYTTNINTEMNYWPALPCSMPELLEPLESQIRIIAKTGRQVARDLYGVSGIAASHNSDIFGQAFPAGGLMDWSYFPVSFAWLVRELFNKYEYTCDENYLARIYGLLEGAAEFILNSLEYDGEYLILSPGTSPENKYLQNGTPCAAARSTTMFASIARDAIKNYIKASDILGKESELVGRAKESLSRMLPLRITDDGRIEEWYFGGESKAPEECEPHHRHISHLYDLYPAREINRSKPELFSAAKKSLAVRGDEATGWSLGWKINCYARLFDGEGVMRLIKMFLRPISSSVRTNTHGGGIYPNLMCAHPPFQIDGNFGFATAMCEMLVGFDGDTPVPLPALPEGFSSGSMRGMSLRGGKRADIVWQDGKLTEFNVY